MAAPNQMSGMLQTKKTAQPVADQTEAQPPSPIPEPPVSTGMTAMTMRLRPEVHRRLKVIGFTSNIPMAKLIEQAIDEWVTKHHPR